MPRQIAIPFVAIILALLVACDGPASDVQTPADTDRAAVQETHTTAPDPSPHERPEAQIVEIIAIHDHESGQHLFQLESNEIDAGWTTFRLINASPDEHFVLLARLPDDPQAYDDPITFEYWHENVTIPFQQAMNNILDPEIDDDEAFTPFAALPDWFADVEQFGGPGFTAPGRTSETTVRIVPGNYVMECYVKDGDEQFHSYLGMLEQITVRDADSDAPEPGADLHITLSSTGGIQFDGEPRAGTQTVAVHYADQNVYEHMVGHDVHLVRLNGTEVETVARWMNWMVPGALVAPAPATFVGGSQTMAAGHTAYVRIDLEPGDYAWISEVPAEHEMWTTFTIAEDVQGAGNQP
jgi:hypothetical protein